ncbi:major facilitator superfamily domain-containing protein [Phycomyces nitens]|nr:major facilitator superfamily domain-containing protein [Phycomyces nitens]
MSTSSQLTLPRKSWIQWTESPIASCIAGSLILWASTGIRQSFGVYLIPVTKETGWDRTSFSIAAALLQLFFGFAQPFLVYLAEQKLGFGKTISAGNILYGVGCFIMYGSSGSSGLFIFSMGVVVGGSAGMSSFPNVLGAIGRRFPLQSKRQKMAFGIVSSFGSFGQCCYLPMARAMIDSIGWKNTSLVFGAIMVGLAPLGIFLKTMPRIPAEPEQNSIIVPKEIVCDTQEKHQLEKPSGEHIEKSDTSPDLTLEDSMGIVAVIGHAMVSPSFLLISVGFFICGFHVSFISTHFPAYLEDHGISASVGAWTISIIGLGSMFGTILTGYLNTLIRPKYTLAALFLGRTGMTVMLLWAPLSNATVFTFSVIFGICWLSTVPPMTQFIGDIFGHKYIGTLFSLSFVAHQIGGFLGAYVGGIVYDSTGSYIKMWYATLALGGVAVIVFLLAPNGKYARPLSTKIKSTQ